MIIPIAGDDLGIEKNSHYRLVEWNKKGRVVFSLTKQGNAMKCHFSATNDAIRHLRKAFEDFISWLFNQYSWCKMIIATIIKEKTSIMRLVEKCRFKHIQTISSGAIYARLRHG